MAKRGDARIIALVWDRLEGKPVQPIDVSDDLLDRSEWAEEKLHQLMQERRLSRKAALALLQRRAPTVAKWIN
jgi:hypothetical protein